MKKFSKQSGFAVMEIILIFVILGIVGFTGWYVWNSKKNTNKTYDSSSAASQAKAASAKKSSNAKPSPPPQQYLVIKEWGVKIPLSASIEKAHYTISNSSAPEEIVYLLDTTFDNTKNANGKSCAGTYEPGMFAIARVKKADINQVPEVEGEQSGLLANGESKVMPGYYVSGSAANQAYPGCTFLDENTATLDNNIKTLWTSDKKAFTDAFAQLQKS
jgi:hypothetical protein